MHSKVADFWLVQPDVFKCVLCLSCLVIKSIELEKKIINLIFIRNVYEIYSKKRNDGI